MEILFLKSVGCLSSVGGFFSSALDKTNTSHVKLIRLEHNPPAGLDGFVDF